MMNHYPRMTTTTQDAPHQQPWMLPETAWGWTDSTIELENLVKNYLPISLEQMEVVTLLNRTYTKFMMTNNQLLIALAALKQDYKLLCVNGLRLNHYRTLYFDTPDFALYLMHVNERADRYKVRSREYTDSSLSFLEVKHKTSKGRTIKDRIPTHQPVVQITPGTNDWLSQVFPYDCQRLVPTLWNTFTRLTLVSKQNCERVTLDVGLTFYITEKVVHLGGVAIAEVKTDAENRASPFLLQMRTQKIPPRGFSKYCIGTSMLYDQVKKNTLKPKLLWIAKKS